eukprot:scaffold4772_cov153-Amphora_coffeaeformis.AAC.8
MIKPLRCRSWSRTTLEMFGANLKKIRQRSGPAGTELCSELSHVDADWALKIAAHFQFKRKLPPKTDTAIDCRCVITGKPMGKVVERYVHGRRCDVLAIFDSSSPGEKAKSTAQWKADYCICWRYRSTIAYVKSTISKHHRKKKVLSSYQENPKGHKYGNGTTNQTRT